MGTVEYASEVYQLLKDLERLSAKLSYGNFGFKYEEVLKSYADLFERFCPFKVGDEVVLIKRNSSIDTNPNHCYYSHRHSFKAGARGLIRARRFSDGKFIFEFEPYQQVYEALDGSLKPTKIAYLFLVSEDEIAYT